jgi:hypothetical protein
VLFVVMSMALAIISGKQRGSAMDDVSTAPPEGVVEQVEGEHMMDSAEEEQAAAGDETATTDEATGDATGDAAAAPGEEAGEQGGGETTDAPPPTE